MTKTVIADGTTQILDGSQKSFISALETLEYLVSELITPKQKLYG